MFLAYTIAGLLTLFVYSFLYKDNPFYRLAEHLVVGVSLGFGFVYSFQQIFIPFCWNPLMEGHYDVLIPALIGLMWWPRFIPKWAWLSRYPIALTMGFFSGFSIPNTIQASILVQVQHTMLNFAGTSPYGGSQALYIFNQIVIFIGVFSVLIYFYFSKPHKGALGHISKIGIWYLMIGFGATFGFTVMGRISLLIGRLQFIITDWLQIVH
ncbi:MAG: hypothetical protein JXA60_07260 [Candidatus Coatesbacteria bacterium]|nr:hypothetical protein [Candidatus Coatesbacteria bacterium]